MCVAAAACADDPGAGSPDDAGGDRSAEVFDSDHVLEVEIEVAQADWDRIRFEGRSAGAVFNGCVEALEYTYVPAAVTVDGERMESVQLRKKGFLGSLSASRPSLKVNFGRGLEGQTYKGMKRLTLNNNRQDQSNTRTCMAYDLFRAAGVHTPRCNLAHVTVNGEDLGYYSNVESIKKPFLERSFGDDAGNLYEGQGVDIREDMLDQMEKKTNEAQADFGDLEALAAALETPDGELLPALEPLLDVDGFYDFWAAEVLTSHWDGYSGNLNNYYLYVDPGDGKARFIPWGTDGAFSPHSILQGFGAVLPDSVLAWSRIPTRLYAIAETRDRFRARLQEQLDQVWDEEALLARVDAIEAMTERQPAQTSEQRRFIGGWRDRLQAELDGSAPDWPVPERPVTTCNDAIVPIELSIEASWGDIDDMQPAPANRLVIDLGSGPENFDFVVSSAGFFSDATATGGVTTGSLRVMGVRSDGSYLMAMFVLGQEQLTPGSLPLHGMEVVGFLVEGSVSNLNKFDVLGILGEGALRVERGAEEDGSRVLVHHEGTFRPVDFL